MTEDEKLMDIFFGHTKSEKALGTLTTVIIAIVVGLCIFSVPGATAFPICLIVAIAAIDAGFLLCVGGRKIYNNAVEIIEMLKKSPG